MINGYNQIDYDRMAKAAVAKNIGYFLRKLSRKDDIPKKKRRRTAERTLVKTSKYIGISYSASYKKPWKATYASKYLGTFETEEEAYSARLEYEEFVRKSAEIAA